MLIDMFDYEDYCAECGEYTLVAPTHVEHPYWCWECVASCHLCWDTEEDSSA